MTLTESMKLVLCGVILILFVINLILFEFYNKTNVYADFQIVAVCNG